MNKRYKVKCAYCKKKLMRILRKDRKYYACNTTHQMKHAFKIGIRDNKTALIEATIIAAKVNRAVNVLRIQKYGYSSRITNQGYRVIYVPDIGDIYEHRFIWIKNNMMIPKNYQVHHMDGDKLNNDLSNLLCLHNRDHMLLHRLQRGV